jgi:hypothetical protein
MSELREHVADKIGKIARPANLVFTPELPKMGSGKLMRRLLRDVADRQVRVSGSSGSTKNCRSPALSHESRASLTGERGLHHDASPSRSRRGSATSSTE